MKITEPGRYRLTADMVNRGSSSVGTLRTGTEIRITQVDRETHQVIGPMLADWTWYDLPVERIG